MNKTIKVVLYAALGLFVVGLITPMILGAISSVNPNKAIEMAKQNRSPSPKPTTCLDFDTVSALFLKGVKQPEKFNEEKIVRKFTWKQKTNAETLEYPTVRRLYGYYMSSDNKEIQGDVAYTRNYISRTLTPELKKENIIFNSSNTTSLTKDKSNKDNQNWAFTKGNDLYQIITNNVAYDGANAGEVEIILNCGNASK